MARTDATEHNISGAAGAAGAADSSTVQPAAIGADTVEAVVRAQLSKALGGKRGMVEAAVPTLGFAYTFLATEQLRTALLVGGSAAAVLLAVRLVQRQTPQFVLNSLFGFGIAAAFVLRTGRAEDIFLPGMILTATISAMMIISILVRWPFVGLLIGSATGDLGGWRRDRGVVRLCSTLTWLFVLPNLIKLAVQVPLYLAGGNLAALTAAKIALGWPLWLAAFAAMLWVLARGRTPLAPQQS